MDGSRQEHALTVTVMRLGRPTLYSSPVVDTDDVPARFTETDCKDVTRLPDLAHVQVGELMLLPQKFDDIHLGETLSCYVCVCNCGDDDMSSVELTVDLQTVSQRMSLKMATFQCDTALTSGMSCGSVVHHEVKELGSHMLICNVAYVDNKGESRALLKRFKFDAHKPLDVKTKFYSSSAECVYLEAQIQNITRSSIFMERVTMEPSSLFSLVDTGGNNKDSKQRPLASQDSRLYLFCVEARSEVASDWRRLAAATNVGKLDISWRSALGQRGRIQTSQLHRVSPASASSAELRVNIEEAPSVVQCLQIFSIGCRVQNTSARAVQLWLRLSTAASSITGVIDEGDVVPRDAHCLCGGGGLVWRGASDCHVADIGPGDVATFRVSMEARSIGLYSVSGITLVDRLTNKAYDFNNLAQIMVTC